MTEVFIKNFQSIKDIHFAIDGFTVIVGKNNIGKSAVIRAIDAALSNEAGSEFIRQGEKETSVRIVRDNIDFEWKKGDSASYTVKGEKEPFTKLNRAIPKPLIDAGFEKLEIDDKLVNPLIASQFEPLFLLDKRGSVITEVLTAMYDMDLISIADDKCQKDFKAQKSLLKTREIDFKTLQGKLSNFKDFEDVKTAVKGIVDLDKKCSTLQEEVDELIAYEAILEQIEQVIGTLKGIVEVDVPDPSICDKSLSDYQWLKLKEKEFSDASDAFKKLKGVKKVEIPTIAGMEDLIAEVGAVVNWDESLTEINKNITKQSGISTIDIPSPISVETLMSEVALLEKWIGQTSSINESIKKLKGIKGIDLKDLNDSAILIESSLRDFSDISDLEKTFVGAAASAKTCRDDLKSTTTEWSQKTEEFNKIDVCPLCERPRHG